MRRKFAVLLAIVLLIAPLGATAQQGGTTFYVYDANGRLSVVITPDGQAAMYQYDAAGNFTAISRIPATTLQVYGFNPSSGGAGDQVTIFGTGFGSGSGVTAVAFNGVSATILSANANSVVATVPTGATTGPVSVTTAAGTATSSGVFSIVSRVRIAPTSVTMLIGQTFQFTDLDSIPGDTGVTWSVNGAVGGNSTVGTISASGLYTAPNTASNSITVTVASNLQPAASASAQVSVVSQTEFSHLYSSVSVQVGNVVFSGNPILLSSVSVRLGSSFDGKPVNVYGPAVSVSTGPVISSVSPATIHRGTTVTTFTITGHNLAGVTSIAFVNGAAADTQITASNIVASSDGTSVTATVTVGGGATLQQDTVLLIAGSLRSTLQGNPLGSNTVQVSQ